MLGKRQLLTVQFPYRRVHQPLHSRYPSIRSPRACHLPSRPHLRSPRLLLHQRPSFRFTPRATPDLPPMLAQAHTIPKLSWVMDTPLLGSPSRGTAPNWSFTHTYILQVHFFYSPSHRLRASQLLLRYSGTNEAHAAVEAWTSALRPLHIPAATSGAAQVLLAVYGG